MVSKGLKFTLKTFFCLVTKPPSEPLPLTVTIVQVKFKTFSDSLMTGKSYYSIWRKHRNPAKKTMTEIVLR